MQIHNFILNKPHSIYSRSKTIIYLKKKYYLFLGLFYFQLNLVKIKTWYPTFSQEPKKKPKKRKPPNKKPTNHSKKKPLKSIKLYHHKHIVLSDLKGFQYKQPKFNREIYIYMNSTNENEALVGLGGALHAAEELGHKINGGNIFQVRWCSTGRHLGLGFFSL